MEENNLNQNPESNVNQANVQTNEPVVQNTSTNSTENTAQNQTTDKKMNICCLLSFIFSMVGILMFGLPCGIVATILGIIGITTFKQEKQTAKWMGVTGLCVGAVEFVFMSMYVFML